MSNLFQSTAKTPRRPGFFRRMARLSRASLFAAVLILVGGEAALAHEFTLGDLTRARSEYREAVRLEPGFADARSALARLGG